MPFFPSLEDEGKKDDIGKFIPYNPFFSVSFVKEIFIIVIVIKYALRIDILNALKWCDVRCLDIAFLKPVAFRMS